jgi:hypothetical protein
MNTSLPRLIDGMIATLRQELIPNLQGDFARGQAYGLIYMLNSIRLRASWSNEFLGEQLNALDEASRALSALAPQLPGAPPHPVVVAAALPGAAELEAQRDAGDKAICDLIDWLGAHRTTAPATAVAEADAIIAHYIQRQLKWELTTSAKPMFEEMSRGSD